MTYDYNFKKTSTIYNQHQTENEKKKKKGCVCGGGETGCNLHKAPNLAQRMNILIFS